MEKKIILLINIIFLLSGIWSVRRSRVRGYYMCSLVSTVFLMQLITNYQDLPQEVINLLSLLFYVSLITVPPLFFKYLSEPSRINRGERFSQLHMIPALVLLVVNILGFLIISFARSASIFFTITYDIIFFLNFTVVTFFFVLQNGFYVLRMSLDARREHQVIKNWRRVVLLIAYVIFITAVYIQQIVQQGNTGWWLTLLLLTYLLSLLAADYFWRDSVEQSLTIGTNNNDGLIEEDLVETIDQKLVQILEGQEIYKRTDLSLLYLAKEVETNSKYLRYVIQKKYQTNFVSFVNSYRVREAQALLENEESTIYTIESIGLKAGFRSKSSFYSAFRESTGLTPNQYRKQYLANEKERGNA